MKFLDAVHRRNDGPPPVWMMRQAGRYHSHYQKLKEKYTFEQLCKNPELAAEVALGPVRDFDFDAAILFSDILFPLELLGVPLEFAPGPKLGFLLQAPEDLKKYIPTNDVSRLAFQAEALQLTRAQLPQDKGLIGFVGGLLTLYVFAVHGTHKTDLTGMRQGLQDGRFQGFVDLTLPLLQQNILLQAAAKPDALAIFESCAGDITLEEFENLYLPVLSRLITNVKTAYPNLPLIYYGKDIGRSHWHLLKDLPISVLGVDQYQNMTEALREFSSRYALQGNFDPDILTPPEDEALPKMRNYFDQIYNLPKDLRRGWICGLGHGVTPKAREENVRAFVTLAREMHR